MKISNSGANPMQTVDTAKSGKVGVESAVQNKKADKAELNSSAKVELSARAQDIKKAKELATPDSGIDEAKVARLQAMIDKGEYKVDAQAIADRLVDEHLRMPS